MVWTNTGKDYTTQILGGSLAAVGSDAWYIAIGTGSQAVTATRSGLNTETDRNQITGNVDLSTARQLIWTADFNFVEMSGTDLKEFGLFSLSSGGKAWIQSGFANITFDGDEELQIEIKGKVY